MKCALCKFWNLSRHLSRLTADHLSEQCRRHAPIVQLNPPGRTDVTKLSVWPITKGSDFCGDFEKVDNA